MQEILHVRELRTYYHAPNRIVPAVDGVSFTLYQGEVLGIVGESGSGKSTVVRSITRIFNPLTTKIEGGEILFEGQNLASLPERELRRVRGKRISMVFQNAQAALDPVYTIGNQLGEAVLAHERLPRKALQARACELLRQVNIPEPETRLQSYPHQLSGGMQQRVLIAMALACRPRIILADEPTTALDVTIQAQILKLLSDIRTDYGMSIILITHNMGVIAEMCDRMLVMYGGAVMEEGSCAAIFAEPLHPYTQGLLACIPSVAESREALYSIPGQVPRFCAPVTACRFCGRCPKAFALCREKEPPLLASGEGGRFVRCWLFSGRRPND